MCHLNSSNNIDSRSGIEGQSEDPLRQAMDEVLGFTSNKDDFISQILLTLINNQTKVLQDLADIVKLIGTAGEALKKREKPENYEFEKKLEKFIDYTVLDNDWIFNNESQYEYSLEVVNDIPRPACKNKGFSLELRIVDLEGNEKHLNEPGLFKILLFTSELHPNLLTSNSSGDRIIRGTLEVKSNTRILFKKIRINEVSSYTPSKSFTLVVISESSERIKPLVIRNVKVKSRVRETFGVKKPKVGENDKRPQIS